MKLEAINDPELKINEDVVPVSLDYILENIKPVIPVTILYKMLEKPKKSVEILIIQEGKEYRIVREFSILTPGEYVRRVINSIENI